MILALGTASFGLAGVIHLYERPKLRYRLFFFFFSQVHSRILKSIGSYVSSSPLVNHLLI